jgi:hypothetical protein
VSEVVKTMSCPECHTPRSSPTGPCTTCGAPPPQTGNMRGTDEEVRTEDLEPYVTLRYIARLFKVLAILVTVANIGEIILGFMAQGGEALPSLIGGVVQLLVIAGLMWAGGDIAVLLIDLGHDIRVSRILLGRINAELHRVGAVDHPRPAGEQRSEIRR